MGLLRLPTGDVMHSLGGHIATFAAPPPCGPTAGEVEHAREKAQPGGGHRDLAAVQRAQLSGDARRSTAHSRRFSPSRSTATCTDASARSRCGGSKSFAVRQSWGTAMRRRQIQDGLNARVYEAPAHLPVAGEGGPFVSGPRVLDTPCKSACQQHGGPRRITPSASCAREPESWPCLTAQPADSRRCSGLSSTADDRVRRCPGAPPRTLEPERAPVARPVSFSRETT